MSLLESCHLRVLDYFSQEKLCATALDSILIKELIFVTNIIIILAIFLEAERKHMNFNIASGKQSCQICTQQESIRACYIDVAFKNTIFFIF